MVGWLWGGWLLAVGWGVFVESDHGEHLAGFFAGLSVHEEVLDEDLWSSGVWCTVLAVVVLLEIVLLRYSLDDYTDLNGLALGMSHTVALRS
jgi:hypothetical protein